MKKKYFIANWKEHKTEDQAREWLDVFQGLSKNLEVSDCEIILCPSFALLSIVSSEIKRMRLPLKLGSQDFPAFDDGPYTGEESPHLLREFIDYAIIGHSERREHFHESDGLIEKKIRLASALGIMPVLCVQDEKTPIPDSVSFVAYEPIFAIGSGTADTPENAEKVAENIAKKTSNALVIYGGSVTEKNVLSFVSRDMIQGVLVGSGSLNPQSFFQIIYQYQLFNAK